MDRQQLQRMQIHNQNPLHAVETSNMPPHTPHHQQSLSNSYQPHENFYSAANAVYSAGQTLSSIGASAGHWPNITSTVSADNRPFSQHNADGTVTGLPLRTAQGGHSAEGQDSQFQQQYHNSRRAIDHLIEESHLPHSGSAMSDIQHYGAHGAPQTYGGDNNVSIKLEPSTPQYPVSVPGSTIPGTLQPGSSSRPAQLGSHHTAPSLPTLPHLSTHMQQPPLSARPMALNSAHSYSKSSPGGMDQPKYKAFTNTPEGAKYASPTTGYVPQSPLGPSSYSPLGLADIRPRANTGLSDTLFSPSAMPDTDALQYPTNSNYLAPWPIYAVDWCKWPTRSNGGAGKIAIGSYLEDNHNYVSVEI